jgi:hypothetical protein
VADREEILRRLDDLQAAYISVATEGDEGTADFDANRTALIAIPDVKERLPAFVVRYRKLKQFWPYIKPMFAHWADRRAFIYEQFAPVMSYVEHEMTRPADDIVAQGLASLDAEHIHSMWRKALSRRTSDPEGAITATRALVESVLKLILDEAGEQYADDAELPKLYSQVAKKLNLSPAQHSEQVFKQILGGCQSVVEGIGSVRNRFGDAHGKGKKPVKPAPRHAELVVNLGGAMAVFVAATWAEQKPAEQVAVKREATPVPAHTRSVRP